MIARLDATEALAPVVPRQYVRFVGSRTSPTSLGLAVDERLNLTVCGYLRQGSMNVYTHPERIRA